MLTVLVFLQDFQNLALDKIDLALFRRIKVVKAARSLISVNCPGRKLRTTCIGLSLLQQACAKVVAVVELSLADS
jgi:hypothetical protein